MRTYKEVLEDGIQLLETAAIEEARLDAWLLLEYTADITRAWYYAHMDDGLDAKTEERYRTLCTKRAQHIPLQHITGRAYFMGYEFCVDERVLVPTGYRGACGRSDFPHEESGETADPGYVYRFRMYSSESSSGIATGIRNRCGCFRRSTLCGKGESKTSGTGTES